MERIYAQSGTAELTDDESHEFKSLITFILDNGQRLEVQLPIDEAETLAEIISACVRRSQE